MAKTSVLGFDGQDDFVSLATTEQLGLTDSDFTVEAWVRVEQWSPQDLTVLGTDQTGLNVGLHLVIRNRRPYMGFYNNDLEGRTELALATWYHLAFRYDKTKAEQAIFVNGVLDSVGAGKVPFQGKGPVNVGRWAGNRLFNGQISDLRIWKAARGAGEIARDMHRRLSGDEPGLTGYWRLDSVVVRNSRQPVDGLYRGEPQVVDVGCLKIGNLRSLTFDGIDDRVAAEITVPLTEITQELWLKTDQADAGIYSLTGQADGGNGFDRLLFLRSGNLFARVWRGGSIGTSGLDLADGEWHHVAHVVGASVGGQRLYVDGIERARGPQAASDFDWQKWCLIGFAQDSTRPFFKGELAEVRIWSRARTPAEIRAGMYLRLGGGEPGLLGLWPLEDGDPKTTVNLVSRVGGEASPPQPAPVEPDKASGLLAGNPAWLERASLPLSDHRSLELDGGAKVEIGDYPVLRTPHYTLELWVKTRWRPGEQMPVAYGEARQGARYKYNLSILPGGELIHYAKTPDGLFSASVRLGKEFAWGEWNHFAINNNGSLIKIFVNGELLSEGPSGGDRSVEASTPADPFGPAKGLVIGTPEGLESTPFRGRVAEARLWDRARTLKDIKADMRRRLRGGEEGLIGWWPLNEAGGDRVLDHSGHGHHGAKTAGNAVVSRAPFAKALRLDGRDDYAEIPHTPDINFVAEQDFTVESWVRVAREQPDQQFADNSLIEKWTGARSYPYVIRYVRAKSQLIGVRYAGTEGYPVVRSQPTDDDEFHHVALVKRGANLTLLRNGIEEQTLPDNTAGRIRNDSALYLGCRGGNRNFFHGEIAELRIWSRALPVDEMWSRMRRQATGDEAGLAGYWRLGSESAERAIDGILRPAGENQGAARVAGDLPLLDQPTEEEPDWPTAPAPSFVDGRQSHVRVPKSDAMNFGEQISVEAWVAPTSEEAELWRCPVVSQHGVASGWQLSCSAHKAGFMVTVDGKHIEVSTELDVEPGSWIHLAGTYDGRRQQLYLNGVPVVGGGRALSGSLTLFGGDLNIGRNPYWPERLYRGRIAEPRLWSVARSAGEIQANIFRRLGVPAQGLPGLVGCWPLDDGDGEAVQDVSRRGHVGSQVALEWTPAELPPRLPAAPFVRISLEEKLAAAEAELKTAKAERDNLSKEKSQLSVQVQELGKALEGEKARARELVAQTEARLGELIAAKEQQIQELQDEKERREEGRYLLRDIYTNALDQVEQARAEIERKGGSYRLGPVSVEMKYVAMDGGHVAEFPAIGQEVDSQRFTTHRMEFAPRPAEPPPPPKPREVPNLRGHTETMARRRLAEAGLLIETHYQAVAVEAGKPSPAGRVVDQYPSAGGQAPPNSSVIIFIGKES